jgi:hypothetical protein
MRKTMRQILTIFIAGFGLALILSGSRYPHRASAVFGDIDDDKRLEAPFRLASEVAERALAREMEEGEGCDAIPYVDVRRECGPLMEAKSEACHAEGRMSCANQTRALEIARGQRDAKAVANIRKILVERLELVEGCVVARKEGLPVWDDAFDKVTADKRRFSTEQQRAKDSTTKTFYRLMVGYSDRILNYYVPAIRTHKEKYHELNPVVNQCKALIREADKPL